MRELAKNQRDTFSSSGNDYHDAMTPAAERQQETDHRIANGVQFAAAMLRHEGRRITSVAEARAALTKAADRLSAVAHMHRQLTQLPPDHEVELKPFITPFCDDISRTTGVNFQIDAEDVNLRADVAGEICIVLNELATNTRKHGAPDDKPVILAVKAMRNGSGGMRLVLRDNGRGLPEDFSLQEANGLGMTIVTSTVEKRGGNIRVLPGPGAGFRIDLPMSAGAAGHVRFI